MGAAKGKVPAVNVTVGDTTYPAGKPLPDGVAELIDNPKVWQAVEESSPAGGAYDDLLVDDLKDEIDARNEGRAEDAQISKSGNKADLIAALEADDAGA